MLSYGNFFFSILYIFKKNMVNFLEEKNETLYKSTSIIHLYFEHCVIRITKKNNRLKKPLFSASLHITLFVTKSGKHFMYSV